MKNKGFQIFSSVLALLCTLAVLLPQNAGAVPAEFEIMIARLTVLEELANSYRSRSGVSTDVDQLMLSYIRSTRYQSTTWNISAGTPDEGFIDYVAQQSPDTEKLRSMGDITLPNGDVTDCVHMFAVMNMVLRGYGDLGGWIGDTCQMLQDIQGEAGDAEQLTEKARQHFRVDGYFGLQDWIADVDGYNLTQEKADGETWAACLTRYFSADLTEKKRVAKFVQKNWGSLYTRESGTREEYRDFVKSRYSSGEIALLQVSLFGWGKIPEQKYRDAVCYAVADYMYETLCAPQPSAETVRIDFGAESLLLSDGIIANASSDFSGAAYTTGSAATPGMVLYAKGSRDVESGSFFPSETVTITLPERPDAPTAPQLSAATEKSLDFIPAAGMEYSIDGGTSWQDSPVFSELLPHTEYAVLCRTQATQTDFASENSAETKAKTGLPTGFCVSSGIAFFPAGDKVQMLLLAAYADSGQMTEFTAGVLADGMWSCALPEAANGKSYRLFVISADSTPLSPCLPVAFC